MKLDIIISGVGGQGILSIAFVLVDTAHKMGLNFKQTEVHGMSQRGGGVESHVRISDEPIHSDMIGNEQADYVLGIEPMEALRFVPYLSKSGRLITSIHPEINISNYPQLEKIYSEITKHSHIVFDSYALGKYAGSPKAGNMVTVGAILPFITLDHALIREAVNTLFEAKGRKLVETNYRALEFGEYASTFYIHALNAHIEPEDLFYPAIRRKPVPPTEEEITLWKEILDSSHKKIIISYLKEIPHLFKVDFSKLQRLTDKVDQAMLEDIFTPVK